MLGRKRPGLFRAAAASACALALLPVPSGAAPEVVDIGLGDHDATVFGSYAGSLLTLEAAMAAGDVSGDGIDDLVLGEPGNDRAYVFFGPLAPGTSFDLAATAPDVVLAGLPGTQSRWRSGLAGHQVRYSVHRWPRSPNATPARLQAATNLALGAPASASSAPACGREWELELGLPRRAVIRPAHRRTRCAPGTAARTGRGR